MEVAHTNTSEKRTQPRHIRAWTISLTMCLTGSFSGRLVFLVPIIKVTTPFTPSSKASSPARMASSLENSSCEILPSPLVSRSCAAQGSGWLLGWV